jgi:hypothetical protein
MGKWAYCQTNGFLTWKGTTLFEILACISKNVVVRGKFFIKLRERPKRCIFNIENKQYHNFKCK